VNALSQALYGEDEIDEDEIRFWLGTPDLLAFVALVDGEVAGYGDLSDGPVQWMDLRVPPGVGADGAAAGLIEALEGRAVARKVRALVPSNDELLARLFGGRGYRVVRHSFRMYAGLDAPVERPAWPEGLRVRAFAPGDDDVAVYEAHQESFADQHEFRRLSFTEWRRHQYREPFDPSLSFLAEEGGELAGICLCRPKWGNNPALGWVSALGVRRPWRRRGLGLALLLHAFGELQARGKRRVGLGVDGSNPTGAVRLYERAGMRVERRLDHCEKQLPA